MTIFVWSSFLEFQTNFHSSSSSVAADRGSSSARPPRPPARVSWSNRRCRRHRFQRATFLWKSIISGTRRWTCTHDQQWRNHTTWCFFVNAKHVSWFECCKCATNLVFSSINSRVQLLESSVRAMRTKVNNLESLKCWSPSPYQGLDSM